MRYQRDYNKALKSSVKLINRLNVKSIPIDIKDIIKKIKKVKIISYSDICEKYNCSISELIEQFQTDYGICVYNEVYGQAIIYYNDILSNEGLERFTIAHELGHYLLQHFDEIDGETLRRGGLTKHEYKVLEDEANCFARNLLSPAALVHFFKISKYPKKISSVFNIGYKASNTRVGLFKTDYAMLNESILNFFEKRFLKYIIYYSNLKDCSNCHSLFSFKNSNYCPICGSMKIKLHEGIDDFNMIYSNFEIFDFINEPECPKCNNEELETTDNFCKICGVSLFNYCSNCGNIDQQLPSNSRYCPICGAKSIYFINGFLVKWEEEKNTIPAHDFIPTFEFAKDDDLPF